MGDVVLMKEDYFKVCVELEKEFDMGILVVLNFVVDDSFLWVLSFCFYFSLF